MLFGTLHVDMQTKVAVHYRLKNHFLFCRLCYTARPVGNCHEPAKLHWQHGWMSTL
jgi:hypothetical protein